MKIIKQSILSLTLFAILISCEKEKEFEYPIVYTGDVINITDTSALFTAKISNFGKRPILESGFIWGIHSNDYYGIKLKNNKNPGEVFSLKTNIKILPDKTHYVRAYVQTEFTTTYGREVRFNGPNVPPGDSGKWSQIYKDNISYGGCEYINTSFTTNDTTFLAFGDGKLYSYDTKTNTFNYELTNTILTSANYSTIFEDNVYIFSENSFFLFNPQSRSFSQLAVLNEEEKRYGISGFLIDNCIYIGLGSHSLADYSKEFWKYNISTDDWQQVASFPGEYRSFSFSFSLNNAGYIGGGFNLIPGQWPYPKFYDLWCYLPETDNWIQKASLPFKNEKLFDLQGANNQEYGYCFYQNKLYEYNPDFDIWENMPDLDTNTIFCYPHSFTLDDKVFVANVVSSWEEKHLNMWVYEK